MKTQVIMIRELLGYDIRQQSKTEFFSATDLAKAGNVFRFKEGRAMFNMSTWLKSESTKLFIAELEASFDCEAVDITRGRNGCTWVHPLLFIDMALAISPKLKIEIYSWVMDELLKHRNNSGDTYKAMCGALYVRHGDKQTYPNMITSLARDIKSACGVTDWQAATEEQLKRREKIHYDISLLSSALNNNEEAIRIGLTGLLNG